MQTHTHTTKWDKITKGSIAAFSIGFVGVILIDLNRAEWTDIPELLLGLAALVGLIMSFVGAPKVFGGLRTGVTALIIGAVFFIVGMGLLDQVGSDTILGVEFLHFSDPKYVIGSPLRLHGIWFMLIGGIMAAVTYLRRVLRAVESKSHPSN